MTYLQLAYIHLATVLPAFVIGALLLICRKGSSFHQSLGRIYMSLMLGTALITLCMSAHLGPTFLGHFGFIHLFSFLVLYCVPRAYFAARSGRIKTHRNNMIGLYLGGIIIAGAFTFAPGRLLHQWFLS